ncbi:unnamed protein product [Cercospora beticola]|nr:unnamed protein product [Cercospora beticola]
MLWVPGILVLPLLALTVGSDSYATTISARQAEQSTLPACAQTCITQLPNNCQADDVCFCTATVRTAYESCLASQCSSSMQDQLDGLQYQATTCNRPVRNNANTLYGVTWAFLSVAIIFVALRLLSRWRGLNGSGISWDDWVVLASLALVVVLDVSLNQETKLGLATDLYTNTVGSIEEILRWLYIGEILYITVVMTTKIAAVLLYLRIWTADSITKAFRLSCWISIGIFAMTALAFDFAIIFQCSPISYVWNRVTGRTGSCIEVAPLLYIFGALNIIYDVVVYLLPIFSVLRLSIALHKKVGVATLFAIGFVVTIAAIIRLQYVVRLFGAMNLTWEYQYTGLWAIIEANLSVICICAPPIAGLMQRWFSGRLGDANSGYANGSVATQRLFGRRRDDDSDVDTPGIIATEMTQQDEPADMESVLRKGQFDGQSGTSKIGDLDMKSIGSSSTSDMERRRLGSSKKTAALFPEKETAESTALVFRPQPGNSKVEIIHEPPTKPAEARLAYRDEHDVYHEVTITDIPHGRFPMHTNGKARPAGLGALAEAENSDEIQPLSKAPVNAHLSDGDQSMSESLRDSDPQGQGVALPKSYSPPASRSQSPPVSQLGYQSLNGSFVGVAGSNSKRNSQFAVPTRQSATRSISLASGTLEAIDVAAKTPSPPTSQSTQSITTQTDDTSLDEPPQSAGLPIKRQEVVYTPRAMTPGGRQLRSPSKSTQVDEASLSPPPRASMAGGSHFASSNSRSPSHMNRRGPSQEPSMSPEPFMSAPSPPRAQSPPVLQSNLPQVAVDRSYSQSRSPPPAQHTGYRDSSLQAGSPMVDPYEFDGNSPARIMSPPRGPPDQYADEPVTAHTRSVSRQPEMSPPLPATSNPSSSNPPSNEVTFLPRGRSPPRPQSQKFDAPRSQSSEALHSPPLPTRDMGTETDPEEETDNPRTPSVPRGAEDWHLSRTASQLDIPHDSFNAESRMMSRSPPLDFLPLGNDRTMSGDMLPASTYIFDNSRPGSRFRSQSPNMAIDTELANRNEEYPEPSADMGVQAGSPYLNSRPPAMTMPLPAVDIDAAQSPRTASSQAVPMASQRPSESRSPSPTAKMAGIQSPPQDFTDDIRPPLSKAGSDQYVPRAPSPTAMMAGIVPDDYHESRRGSMKSPVRSPSPPRSAAPMFSPRDVTSPRYESADAGTSPMSNGSEDEILGIGIASPRDIDNPGTYSADAGTSPMSDFKDEDSEPDVATASALPTRDIEQQRSNSADRGTSPMSDWKSDSSPAESPGAPSPDIVAPRSLSADRGTSPMHTDSPRSPLPGLASRSASATTVGSKDDDGPLPVRDIEQQRSTSADRGTSPMSDWGDDEAPSPQYNQGKRLSGDLTRRPALSPIQPMRRLSRQSQASSDENTPAHTQLPFANAAGRREIPQPPRRNPSQVALPKGASDIEGTWTPYNNRTPDLDRVDEGDDGAQSPYNMPSVIHSAIIPEDRGRGLPGPPMTYGAIMSPQYHGPRMESEEMNAMNFEERWQQHYGERERFNERANSNDFFPDGVPMFPDEFDTNDRDYSPVRGIDDDDEEEEWPRQPGYEIPHIPSPLLAQLLGAADPEIFDSRTPSRSPSRSRSRSASPDGDDLVRAAARAADKGRREHTRSPSPTRRELNRMGQAAATDVFENNASPALPVPSAVARQANRSARMSFNYDDSRLQSPAGNATGMRSPDVANPDPIHPEILRQELNKRAPMIMTDDGTDMPDTDPPRPYDAQIAALDAPSPPEPSSARLREALEQASPDVGAQDLPSTSQSPDPWTAQLAHMDPNSVSVSRSISRSISRSAAVSLSPSASARIQERQWQSMSPQYNGPSADRVWDEGTLSPPLPVVSPGLDDNNDSTPTTPGGDEAPLRSPSMSPPMSPAGVRLSRTDSFDNGRPAENRTPGSDFLPSRPVSQLDLPTLSDMTSDSPMLSAGPNQEMERDSGVSVSNRGSSDPTSRVSFSRRESADHSSAIFSQRGSSDPSSAVAISSPEIPRRSFERDGSRPRSSRLVPTESTPGENQAIVRSLWMRAESRQSASRAPMSRDSSRAPSFEDKANQDAVPDREANTESWYNPTVMPRPQPPSSALLSPDSKDESPAVSLSSPAKAQEQAEPPADETVAADSYVDSFTQSEGPTVEDKKRTSITDGPSFETLQSQSEAPTADPVADALMSQAETDNEEEVEEKPTTVEMATSPMLENPRMSAAASEQSEGKIEKDSSSKSSDPIAEALLSLVPAGEQIEDQDTAGFVSAPVSVPPEQLAKNISPNAEYDPFKYSSDEEAEKNEEKTDVKQVDEKTLGSLVGQPKASPILASESTRRQSASSGALSPQSDSPLPSASQLNLPSISAVTAEKKQDTKPPTPKVANVEVLSAAGSSPDVSQSDSQESKRASILSDTSMPSVGSMDTDASARTNSNDFDSSELPSTPPDGEAATSPMSAGLKDLFASESPQVAVVGETKPDEVTEKLRRPQPPSRTVSQLAYPDED